MYFEWSKSHNNVLCSRGSYVYVFKTQYIRRKKKEIYIRSMYDKSFSCLRLPIKYTYTHRDALCYLLCFHTLFTSISQQKRFVFIYGIRFFFLLTLYRRDGMNIHLRHK